MTERQYTPQEVATAIDDADKAYHALGIELLHAEPGYAKMSMKVRPDMLNCLGILHGGIMFTLADTSLALAANVSNVVSYTYSSTIHFIASALVGEELISVTREDDTTTEGGKKSSRSGFYTTTVFGKNSRRIGVIQGVTRIVDKSVIETMREQNG